MNLFAAIKHMIDCCCDNSGFHGAIIIDDHGKRYKYKELCNLLKQLNTSQYVQRIEINHSESRVLFINNSILSVGVSNNNMRGRRYHMLILDDEIPDYIVKNITLQCLNKFSDFYKKPIAPVYANFEEIPEQLTQFIKENNNMPTYTSTCTGTLTGGTLFKSSDIKEGRYCYANASQWESEIFPFASKDENGTRILLYNIAGIGSVEYSEEFVNRTKETFLNIKGECNLHDELYKNSVNIHLKIDTDVYDGYAINWADGILTVTLHEIVNKRPKFVQMNSLNL